MKCRNTLLTFVGKHATDFNRTFFPDGPFHCLAGESQLFNMLHWLKNCVFFIQIYPLVNIQSTMENPPIFNG